MDCVSAWAAALRSPAKLLRCTFLHRFRELRSCMRSVSLSVCVFFIVYFCAEGESHIYQPYHCYHDLAWYNSMDHAGWSKCLPNYYVAGLYRSCESLYCLNMAKCCSLEDARWAMCGQTIWGTSFNNVGWSNLGQAGAHAFITGFKRSKVHTISSIDSASYCGFVRGY